MEVYSFESGNFIFMNSKPQCSESISNKIVAYLCFRKDKNVFGIKNHMIPEIIRATKEVNPKFHQIKCFAYKMW